MNQIYCYFEGGNSFKIVRDGFEDIKIDTSTNFNHIVQIHGRNIFIGDSFDYVDLDCDLCIADISSQFNFHSAIVSRFSSKYFVPYGYDVGVDGISLATDFASKIMFHKLGIPKVLIKGQYIIL